MLELRLSLEHELRPLPLAEQREVYVAALRQLEAIRARRATQPPR